MIIILICMVKVLRAMLKTVNEGEKGVRIVYTLSKNQEAWFFTIE